MAILSVSQLNRYVGFKLKEDHALNGILVRGELSNFTNHIRSGHFYFTLKDAESSVKAVMFRNLAQRVRFVPKDGMNVIVAATASLFERDGAFQLYVTDMQPDGAGAQYQALSLLKQKLTALGIFAQEAKRPIPAWPQKIGVVTSGTGAALQDVKNVIGRRYPLATLAVFPAQVQGEGAAASICHAIESAQAQNCDVLIVGRGGGSAEDLQAFNQESVVMAVYHCTVPIISAVGHETDYTLTDYAADLRAPTPSAAAELAVPDCAQLMQQVLQMQHRLHTAMQVLWERHQQAYLRLMHRLQQASPHQKTVHAAEQLHQNQLRLHRAMQQLLQNQQMRLQTLCTKLHALSPLQVLARGYALVYQQEQVVESIDQIQPGDHLVIQLQDGTIPVQALEKGEHHDI